jgi:hypothetical protein
MIDGIKAFVNLILFSELRSRELRPNDLAALQAPPRRPLSTRGIGLRPQPRAPFSRPVGPDGPATRHLLCRRRRRHFVGAVIRRHGAHFKKASALSLAPKGCSGCASI